MVELGLDLPDDLLALACASHSGEPFHVEGVRRTLASAGLDESALQTPADYPLDDDAREAVVRAGGAKAPVLMNCSGKHAAMLATCVLRGWDTATYLDPAHPLQVAIADTFARLTGEPIDAVAVDGCGAPLLSTSLDWRGRSRPSPPRPRVRSAASPRRSAATPSTSAAPPATSSPCTGPSRADRQGRGRVA